MDRTRIIGGAVALIAGALASEAIVRAGYGILSFLSDGGVLTWTAALNAAGLIGLVVGLYFLFRPSNAARKELERERLVANMQSLLADLRVREQRSNNALFGEIVAVYISLDKLGIRTPVMGGPGLNLEGVYDHAEKFVSGICAMVRDGHISAARREAAPLIASFGAEPSIPRRITDYLTPWKRRTRVTV